MGTRRSRHNKGRKPRYKEHAQKQHQLRVDRFLLSESARALTFDEVIALPDFDVYATFIAIRWALSDCKAECPHCQSDIVYSYRSRTIYKCTDCKSQFSATTGTVLAGRKMSYRSILLSIAIFFGGNVGVSAVRLRASLRVQYKSALGMARKLREATYNEFGGELPTIDTEAKPRTLDPALSSPFTRNVNGRFPKRGEIYQSNGARQINQGYTWHADDIAFLRKYWMQGANEVWLGDKLLRTPSTVAYRARDLYLTRPRLLMPKQVLQYPYIQITRTDEHELVLAVNEIVPRGFSEDMRADICQEALLSILNGDSKLADLQAANGMTWFIKNFYRQNKERFGTRSLDAITEEQDRYWGDFLADLHDGERRIDNQSDWMRTHIAAAQIEEIYQSEITQRQRQLDAMGDFWTREEVAEHLESPTPQ